MRRRRQQTGTTDRRCRGCWAEGWRWCSPVTTTSAGYQREQATCHAAEKMPAIKRARRRWALSRGLFILGYGLFITHGQYYSILHKVATNQNSVYNELALRPRISSWVSLRWQMENLKSRFIGDKAPCKRGTDAQCSNFYYCVSLSPPSIEEVSHGKACPKH